MSKLKDTTITLQTLIVTVDIGKSKHGCYMRSILDDSCKPFEIRNDLEGFTYLWQRIKEFQNQHRLDKILFGFESTGSYGEPLVHYMDRKGVALRQINPKHTKKVKELADNSKEKSDLKDPKVLADILLLGHGLTVFIAKGVIADLRVCIQMREQLLVDKTRITNRIESLVVRFFPEYLKVMNGLRSKSSLYLLSRFPLPSQLMRLGKKRLTKHLRKISRGQLAEQKAEQLLQAAKQTIGTSYGVEAMVAMLRMHIKQFDLLQIQIKQIEDNIKDMLEPIPEAAIIQSMKGVGSISAAILLSEIVDFKGYSRVEEVIKLAGLNLYKISSGQFKGRMRISKQGRALLRKTLFYIALNQVKKGGIHHEDYCKHVNKGMKKIQAIVVIAKKILRITYSMVRNETVYKINYEKQKLRA